MTTIGNLWYVWLIGMAISYTVTLINQAKRMFTAFGEENDDEDNDNFFGGFTDGVITFLVSSLIGTMFGLALLVSIVINFIEWVR